MFRLVPKKKLHRSKKLKRFTFSLLNHIIKAYKQSAEVNRMTKKEKLKILLKNITVILLPLWYVVKIFLRPILQNILRNMAWKRSREAYI